MNTNTILAQLATYYTAEIGLKRPRPTFPPRLPLSPLPPPLSPVWDSSLLYFIYSFELFTAILSGLGTFLIAGLNHVVMVSPHPLSLLPTRPQIINNTVDLLYLYLRNLITKGVSSCFEEL